MINAVSFTIMCTRSIVSPEIVFRGLVDLMEVVQISSGLPCGLVDSTPLFQNRLFEDKC